MISTDPKPPKVFLFPWKNVFLFVIITIPYLLPVEISIPLLIFSGFIFLVLSNGKIKISYFKLILPLLILGITGFIGLMGHQFRHVIRDILFALTPIALLFIGYYNAEDPKMWPKILKIIIFAGIFFSIIHLSNFLINPALIFQKVDDIRQQATTPGISLIIVSLVLGVFQKKLGTGNLFYKYLPRYITLPILFLSFLLSFSRVGLMISIILSLSVLGLINRINWRTIVSIGVLGLGIFYFVISTPKGEIGTFRSKITRSLTEVTISDYQDWAEINTNWRGYETYRAFLKYAFGNVNEKIFGFGFGSLVDLGLSIKLGNGELSQIPILHNGYAYILVKTGIIGIICYSIFYIRLIRFSLLFNLQKFKEKIILSRILFGCTLSIILTMYVVGGMAEVSNSEIVLLIGFAFRRLELLSFDDIRQ